MPLDQANAAYLEKLLSSAMPDVRDVPLVQYRQLLADAHAKRPRGPDVQRIEDIVIATPSGPLPLRLYVPSGALLGAMLYLHGGGWTVGSVQGWDPFTRRLANSSGCAVVSVDYRLAPEYPFPAAIDDVMSALAWAADHLPGRLGTALPLLIAGDSAGANLATVAARLVRDGGGPQLAMQLLFYPTLEGDSEAASLGQFDPPRLSKAELSFYLDQYVPNLKDRADPRVSPLRASDHTGLPATLILTAENDILCAQGETYGAKLIESGVSVTIRRYLGTMHGFLTLGDEITQSGDALCEIAAFVWGTMRRRFPGDLSASTPLI